MENRDLVKEREEFLEKLEVGNDGTLFISGERVDYSLQAVLNHAFTLFYYHILNSFGDVVDLSLEKNMGFLRKSFIQGAQLSFSKILYYTNNARKVLKEMKHYDDEEIVENDFDVVVYRSPKDNNVIDFKNFINVLNNGEEYTTTLTTDILHEVYGISNFFVIELDPGFAFGIEDIELVDIESLTIREKEAFYGSQAQYVLGWIPTDLIDSSKKGTFVKVK